MRYIFNSWQQPSFDAQKEDDLYAYTTKKILIVIEQITIKTSL